MKHFTKQIDKRNRAAMVNFLKNHFRYDTMSSWNASTSYAAKMKINTLPLNNKQMNAAYALLDCEDTFDGINDLINDWSVKHDHAWRAGFNGRSGGYLVLYVGHVKSRTIYTFENTNNGRDYADGYGWMDIEEAKAKGLYRRQIKTVGTYPGKSVDMGEDFSEWDIDSLRSRVELVQDFDQLCDDVLSEFIYLCDNAEVKEEAYTVTKTRKVLHFEEQ